MSLRLCGVVTYVVWAYRVYDLLNLCVSCFDSANLECRISRFYDFGTLRFCDSPGAQLVKVAQAVQQKQSRGKYQVKIIRWWQDFSCLLDSGTQGEHKVARLCSEKNTGKNLRLRYADGGKTFDACLCQAHKVSTRWGRLCSKKALGKISG